MLPHVVPDMVTGIKVRNPPQLSPKAQLPTATLDGLVKKLVIGYDLYGDSSLYGKLNVVKVVVFATKGLGGNYSISKSLSKYIVSL